VGQSLLKKFDLKLLFAGFGFLLIGSFLDNLRGPLLTFLTVQLGLGYDQSSWFLVLGHLVGLCFTLSLLPLMRRFGELKTSLSVALAASLFCFSAFLATDYFGFLLFAGFIGSVIAVLGTLSNVLTLRGTPLRWQVRILSALHFMYGFGSVLGPFAASLVLSTPALPWQTLILLALPMLFVTIILLSKANSADTVHVVVPSRAKRGMTLNQVIVLLLFACYVVGEAVSSMWMVTYLVEAGGYSLSDASLMLTGFFVLMASCRVFCFFFVKEPMEIPLLWFSIVVPATIILLSQSMGWYLLMPLMGFVGPFFPLFLGQLTRAFPEEWRALTIWIMVSLQLSLAMAHLLLGQIVNRFGVQFTYWIPLVSFLFAMVFFAIYLRRAKDLIVTVNLPSQGTIPS
jgi:fucose permease